MSGSERRTRRPPCSRMARCVERAAVRTTPRKGSDCTTAVMVEWMTGRTAMRSGFCATTASVSRSPT